MKVSNFEDAGLSESGAELFTLDGHILLSLCEGPLGWNWVVSSFPDDDLLGNGLEATRGLAERVGRRAAVEHLGDVLKDEARAKRLQASSRTTKRASRG